MNRQTLEIPQGKFLKDYVKDRKGKTFTEDEAMIMYLLLAQVYMYITDRNLFKPKNKWILVDLSFCVAMDEFLEGKDRKELLKPYARLFKENQD